MYPIVNHKQQMKEVLYNTWHVTAETSKSRCLQNILVVIMAGGWGTRLYH